MAFVLRKSVDSYSAGTAVRETDHPLVVELETTGALVEIPSLDYLKELRSRSDLVPAVPRKDRPDRVAKRVVYNMKKAGAK